MRSEGKGGSQGTTVVTNVTRPWHVEQKPVARCAGAGQIRWGGRTSTPPWRHGGERESEETEQECEESYSKGIGRGGFRSGQIKFLPRMELRQPRVDLVTGVVLAASCIGGGEEGPNAAIYHVDRTQRVLGMQEPRASEEDRRTHSPQQVFKPNWTQPKPVLQS